MKFLTSGKVKDIYEYDASHLAFKFSDRVSAYDVPFNETIPEKGRVLCAFARYWFDKLPVQNHLIKKISDTEIVVKKMQMIPMECVVRGYFYGSLANRSKSGKITLPDDTSTEIASRLPQPIFDPTTKSKHDMPVNRDQALEMNLVTGEQFDWLCSKSIQIYSMMYKIADSAGFILADLKLEFGIDDGQIILGDSIGPDEYRLWPKSAYTPGRTQDSYDKQILRDWLTHEGHARQFESDQNAGIVSNPPQIPEHIIQKMTRRYIDSYTLMTGQSL